MLNRVAIVALLPFLGCGFDRLVQVGPPVVALFSPSDGTIPMPTDILRECDDAGCHVNLPTDDADLSATEVDLRNALNRHDGWPTTSSATVEFSGPIDVSTVTEETVQVWSWGVVPRRLTRLAMEVDAGNSRLTISAPLDGWPRGERVVVLVRGGADGILDVNGRGIDADAAFYYLRLNEKLDTPENQRAFPGDSRAERLEAARTLEEIRLDLAPYLEFFAETREPDATRIPRQQIASLWTFTASGQIEVAMDRASQRMPLPFDLMLDPHTGLVDLPFADWDTDLEHGAKIQAGELNGFAVSASLIFELTDAVDPLTATAENIKLYEMAGLPREVPLAAVRTLAPDGPGPCQQSPVAGDCVHIILDIDPMELPLAPATTYGIVVLDGLRGAGGEAIVPMPLGHLVKSELPVSVGGVSQIGSIDDELALKVEQARLETNELLERVGRDHVIAAWPFTTLSSHAELARAIYTAETHDTPFEPTITDVRVISDGFFSSAEDRTEAFETLFPDGAMAAMARGIYQLRLDGVHAIIEGTIPSPYLLDRGTRRFRDDGGYELEDVHFILTLPDNVNPEVPVPVVIFGHAVVTDRRFLLTVAGDLAQRGFASIAIDFPFHGERLACVEASLVSIPNFFPDDIRVLFEDVDGIIMDESLIHIPPCASGRSATCGENGQCLTADGEPDEFTSLPVMDMQPVSGAAFLDVNEIPYIKDHFLQALVDLGALKRSLDLGNWSFGEDGTLDTSRYFYAGQSLGAIIGAVYTSVEDDIHRSVLNVPGADMVDLFLDSTFFGPQIEDYFMREQIADGSFEQERLLNVARWIIDSVDPHSIAHLYRTNGRVALLQMDNGDIVIPNATTETLQRVSGLPMATYPLPLHGDLVVPVIGDGMLNDMADFLATGEVPQ